MFFFVHSYDSGVCVCVCVCVCDARALTGTTGTVVTTFPLIRLPQQRSSLMGLTTDRLSKLEVSGEQFTLPHFHSIS